MDFATSSDPAVQAQLDRLAALSPGADILGLSRITALLTRLGDPHLALPPVFHVAGTNGKGSTCAFLRAALEADGRRVHAYTSPHLVRFNERIRLAGTLIEDEALASLLARVLDRAEGIGASFFEVTTAAAFLAFAETPANACVIEVGLGGRLDATNVLVDPAVCGIAQLGIDHQAFLGDTAVAIAAEKAGIAKRGRPLVTQAYDADVAASVATVAAAAGAPVLAAGRDWSFELDDEVRYHDSGVDLALPRPALPGTHQAANLALAVAMLRHQERIPISSAALAEAARRARWPARLQRLSAGPLVDHLPQGSSLWLDGGHNAAAADAVATTLAGERQERPLHLVVGMLANKDAPGFLAPLFPLAASLTAVPIPGHDHHAPAALAQLAESHGVAARTAADVRDALAMIPRYRPSDVAILGSLYLAGRVLESNGDIPD